MEQGLGRNYVNDLKVQERIEKAIHYLTDHEKELLEQPVSNFVLEKGIEIRIQNYNSRDYEAMNYETHDKHIDIHYMLEGQEYLRWWDKETVEPISEYDENEDIIFYPHPKKHNRVLLTPHHYVVFYPEDVHAAHGTVDQKVTNNHKIVVKIDMN